MKTITITAGAVSLRAELNESPTAALVWKSLPMRGVASTWGDEIYFEIPVNTDEELGARAEVEVGELGYWPPGKAFCIFFGRTPVSRNDRPRAYSPVNPLGKILGDATRFRSVPDGAEVRLERAEQR